MRFVPSSQLIDMILENSAYETSEEICSYDELYGIVSDQIEDYFTHLARINLLTDQTKLIISKGTQFIGYVYFDLIERLGIDKRKAVDIMNSLYIEMFSFLSESRRIRDWGTIGIELVDENEYQMIMYFDKSWLE